MGIYVCSSLRTPVGDLFVPLVPRAVCSEHSSCIYTASHSTLWALCCNSLALLCGYQSLWFFSWMCLKQFGGWTSARRRSVFTAWQMLDVAWEESWNPWGWKAPGGNGLFRVKVAKLCRSVSGFLGWCPK